MKYCTGIFYVRLRLAATPRFDSKQDEAILAVHGLKSKVREILRCDWLAEPAANQLNAPDHLCLEGFVSSS